MEKQIINKNGEFYTGNSVKNGNLSNEKMMFMKNVRWGDLIHEKGAVKNSHYLILLCTEGKLSFTLDFENVEMKKRTFILLKPGQFITTKTILKNTRLDAAVIPASFNWFDAMLGGDTALCVYRYLMLNKKMKIGLDEQESNIIQRHFDLLIELDEFNCSGISKNVLLSLVGVFCSMLQRRQAEMDNPAMRRGLEVFDRFVGKLTVYHKIERSVKFYADAIHLSPKYFSWVIKSVTGQTAVEWIDKYVIQEAKKLLQFTEKNISEITYSLNFPTPSFFSRYFKRHVGMTPMEYRRNAYN